jgi:hypothetical protein
MMIRPARLEDAEEIAHLFTSHQHSFVTSEKIRLAIGSSFLNKDSYFVAEEKNQILGVLEQTMQNNLHALISYPMVATHEYAHVIRERLLGSTLARLKSYGYGYISTKISSFSREEMDFFRLFEFKDETVIMVIMEGEINPRSDIESELDYRRVSISDADLAYSWIERQLNPQSPIFITDEYFRQLLNAPKEVRDGWSMAIDPETRQPLAMISSLIDGSTNQPVIFGPFSGEKGIEARVPLLNELLWYHSLRGRTHYRLMRIDTFDNDEELIDLFDLVVIERIVLLTRKL